MYDKFHFEALHFYFLLKEMLRVILKEELFDFDEYADLGFWDELYQGALRSIYVLNGDQFYRIVFKAVSQQENMEQGLELLKEELKNNPCKISFKEKSLVNLACVMVNNPQCSEMHKIVRLEEVDN